MKYINQVSNKLTNHGELVQEDGSVLFGMAFYSRIICFFLIFCFSGPQFYKMNDANASTSLNLEGKTNLAVHGYDLISYHESKPLQGSSKYSFKHETATYQFYSQENLEKFKKDPSKYLPAFGGWCAYAMADGEKVDIDPETYKIVDGKVYLYYNGIWGNTLSKWNKDEVNLNAKAIAAWKKI